MNRLPDRERTYLYMTLATLVVGGGFLIALIYGPWSLLTALPFLLLGALLIIILWLLVGLIAGWREKSEREYHEAAVRHIAQKETVPPEPQEREANGETDSPGS